jgi:hypothetical protein
MTRTYTKRPIWTWQCDTCLTQTADLARNIGELPDFEAMQERGWFIAELSGDMCPRCVKVSDSSTTKEQK